MLRQDYIDALMELKRKGQLSGRDASSKDIAALTSGYFSDAAQRDIQERTLALKEKALAQSASQSSAELALKRSTFDDEIALRNWQMTKQMGAADTASRNQMWGNILSGLVNIGGAYYLGGRKIY